MATKNTIMAKAIIRIEKKARANFSISKFAKFGDKDSEILHLQC